MIPNHFNGEILHFDYFDYNRLTQIYFKYVCAKFILKLLLNYREVKFNNLLANAIDLLM